MTAEEIKIGYWYYVCCYMDLRQIEDETDVEFVREWNEDADLPSAKVFCAECEALVAVRDFSDADCREAIDDRLKELGRDD